MKGRLPGTRFTTLATAKERLWEPTLAMLSLKQKELKLLQLVRVFVWCLLGTLLFPGCARYRYFITEPSNLAQQVPDKPVRLEREPLGYQFSETDKRLAIAVSNPTDNALAINDKKSFIVDPAGQTHPIKAGNIAPRSYITFILPPEERIVRASPTFGFGVGVGHIGYPVSSTAGFYTPLYGPHSYYYHDESETPIWRWKEGPVRLRLSFDAQGATTNSFEQDWTFERRKMK